MMMLAHRLTLPTAVKIWFINRIPTDQLGKSIFLDSKFIIRYYKIGYPVLYMNLELIIWA